MKIPVGQTIGGLLVAGVLVANVGLQRQNATLQSAVQEIRASRGPRPGIMIETLDGKRLSGEKIHLDFAGIKKKTLVLAFSARCPVCTENWPHWRDLIKNVGDRVGVLYLDLADSVSPGYVAKFDIPAEQLLTGLEMRTKWFYDLRETPETIVLGAAGKVEGVWLGRLSRAEMGSLTSLLAN